MATVKPPSLHLVLGNDVAAIQRLACAIGDFGAKHRLPRAATADFALASDELMTNTVSYGGIDVRIEVAMRLEDDTLVLELIDYGVLFDPLSAPPPNLTNPLADRRVGGLGVHIVRTLMDEVHYDCQDGLNKTTIVKHLVRQGERDATETE